MTSDMLNFKSLFDFVIDSILPSCFSSSNISHLLTICYTLNLQSTMKLLIHWLCQNFESFSNEERMEFSNHPYFHYLIENFEHWILDTFQK